MDHTKRQHLLLDLFLWLLVAAMSFSVVMASVASSGGSIPVSDKLIHFASYFGLGMSVLLAAVWAPVRGEGRLPWATVLVSLLALSLGFAVEAAQGPLPERDASFGDAVANTAGVATALIVWTRWRRRQEA